jgi:hypothetical protein
MRVRQLQPQRKKQRIVSNIRFVFRSICQYLHSRLFSLALFILSILMIITGVYLSENLYVAKNPWTNITAINESFTIVNGPDAKVVNDFEITKTRITINYNDEGKQTVTLVLDAKSSDDSLLDKNLILSATNNLRPVSGNIFESGIAIINVQRGQNATGYHYRFFQPGKTATVTAKFEGNLFGSTKSAVNLNFSFVVTNVPDQQIPVNIAVVNLYSLNINYVSPPPIEESLYALHFSFLYGENDISSIHVSGTDPTGVSLEQSKIFLIGIGLGVAFSLAATIIYDLIRFVEEKTESGKGMPMHKKNLSGSLKFKRPPKPLRKTPSKRKTRKTMSDLK